MISDLKTFSAMPTHMVNICAKFAENRWSTREHNAFGTCCWLRRNKTQGQDWPTSQGQDQSISQDQGQWNKYLFTHKSCQV